LRACLGLETRPAHKLSNAPASARRKITYKGSPYIWVGVTAHGESLLLP
jgi:hypothetical protein